MPTVVPTRVITAVSLIIVAASAFSVGAADVSAAARYRAEIVPLLKKYCFECHSGESPEAGLAFDAQIDAPVVSKSGRMWEKVIKQLRTGKMPPEDEPQPSVAERDSVIAWIAGELARVDCSGKPVFPGRVTIRRLSRFEYRNTIRDLVGVEINPESFPEDDIGHGFDNMADVMSLSPLHIEKYLGAAQQIAATAIARDRSVPANQTRILSARPSATVSASECARRILERFASRAFRRPLASEELKRLVDLAVSVQQEVGSFEQGIEIAVQAVLVSPHFLFRIEMDPAPANPGAVRTIDDFELATRLSYFLWSSMPDDKLFTLAAAGALHKSMAPEVRRMLADAKSDALVKSFAGQWLQLGHLDHVTPDPALFPQFDDLLRQAIKTETELFFQSVVREDRSIVDFLTAQDSFVNGRLAQHYGITGVDGPDFRRVSLPVDTRGGVLAHASILTITSNPNRTSPVKRGKWILEQILGTPPPPPPEMVEQLSEDAAIVASASLRQRLELHRAKSECAVCHDRMDPIGFAFENYDAIGAWRTHDGKFPIDASGALPDAESFSGPVEFRELLVRRKDQFCRAFAEKLLTYALGRGLVYYDKCAVDRIVERAKKDRYRFSSLVLGVVESDPFQKRGIEGVE